MQLQVFDQHNAATMTEKIPQSQLLAAFKNGVTKGAHILRYKEALKVMKYRSQQLDLIPEYSHLAGSQR